MTGPFPADRIAFDAAAIVAILFAGPLGRQHLDGQVLAGPLIQRQVHGPHATGAEFPEDAVRAKVFGEPHGTILAPLSGPTFPGSGLPHEP